MGTKLYDEFKPGDTVVDGVPLPYPGWVEQMTGCAPSVAQALLPYPQFCSALAGLNENAGNSTYHSFQLKAEKRFSQGAYLLASYTLSKLLTSSDHVDQPAGGGVWSGSQGVISPFERHRNKGLAVTDVPQVLSVAFLYELPFGSSKRFLNSSGVVDRVFGGWKVSGTFRASGGVPFFFRSSGFCNVPAQFRVGCIPAIKPGANPFAQDKSNFDPNKPFFNKDAFETIDSFNFYYGSRPRMTDLRGFGYHNVDFSLMKETRITETVRFEVRAEFFNLFNGHISNVSGTWGDGAFTNDLASPNFGLWNGAVSDPRKVQVGARISF